MQIYKKYRHLLTSDPTIGPFVPPTPLITYRWATSVCVICWFKVNLKAPIEVIHVKQWGHSPVEHAPTVNTWIPEKTSIYQMACTSTLDTTLIVRPWEWSTYFYAVVAASV